MKQYYHATSLQNALQIEKHGFKPGKDGMFGPGIYFAEKPIGALNKTRSSAINAFVVVKVKVGRLMTEEYAHHDWNLQKVNRLGYDTVQMTHCRTGVEICVYEPHRIEVVGIIQWDPSSIEFRGINCLELDLAEFKILTDGRKVAIFGKGGVRMKNVCFNSESMNANIFNPLPNKKFEY